MNVYGELKGTLTGEENLSGKMTGQKGIQGNLSVAASASGVKDVEVNGTSVVNEEGIAEVTVPDETDPTVPAWAKAPNKPTYTASEVHALPDTTEIPTLLSDLENDEGFITENDIPPLVTDLGYIDPEPYEEDIGLFLNTLIESGFYKFVFEGDDLTYFVQVQSAYIEDSDITLVNQHYWGDEEGPIVEYIRALVLEGDDVIDELTTSYLTMESAVDAFASKSHVHYRTVTAALSVWDYCDGSQILYITDSPILYTDTSTPRHSWLIETTSSPASPNKRFVRLTDMHDASVIYQRSGTYSAGSITWGEWETFNAGGSKAFTVELKSASWSNNTQTVSNNYFIADGYAFIVSPASANYSAYTSAQIYPDDVSTNGQLTFHCGTIPTGDITVNIVRVTE